MRPVVLLRCIHLTGRLVGLSRVLSCGEVFVCSCMYTLTLTCVAVGNARLACTESRTACSHPRHRCTGTLAVLSSRVGMTDVWSAKTGNVASYTNTGNRNHTDYNVLRSLVIDVFYKVQ